MNVIDGKSTQVASIDYAKLDPDTAKALFAQRQIDFGAISQENQYQMFRAHSPPADRVDSPQVGNATLETLTESGIIGDLDLNHPGWQLD